MEGVLQLMGEVLRRLLHIVGIVVDDGYFFPIIFQFTIRFRRIGSVYEIKGPPFSTSSAPFFPIHDVYAASGELLAYEYHSTPLHLNMSDRDT